MKGHEMKGHEIKQKRFLWLVVLTFLKTAPAPVAEEPQSLEMYLSLS